MDANIRQTEAEDLLHSVFGMQAFRPGQADIVAGLLARRNMLVVMPTGAGKSLCYQIPALVFDRLTVVISPLVALMDDQVAALRALGVDAACIHSGRDRDANVADWKRVQSGACKLLYMSPERLMTDRMLSALQKLDPAMFVVDEAHCISKWGMNFRPEYEALSGLKTAFPDAVFSAFTATADEATRRDIAAKLFDGRGETIVHGFDRPNLHLAVEPKADWRRQLLDFIGERTGQSGIVYCLSRRLTEEVSAFLNDKGHRALPYHAGLSAELRRDNQEVFMAEDGVIMVATIAFGMGIDKPDIRYVFHLNLPGSMEAYYQEIGRAGRDGAAADVKLIYGLDDIRMRRQFIDQDGEDDDHRRREHKRLDALLAYCEATTCRRVTLLSYFDETTEPCGNCDICLDPPKLIDATVQAQMLFSAALRTGQAFGAAHLIDILRGAATQKIKDRGHDQLPTYGVGAAHAKGYWQSFIRQALAGGYLSVDIDGYGSLKLTERAEAVLKGDGEFLIREPAPEKPVKTRSRGAAAAPDLPPELSGLLAGLKKLRQELAKARGVPAYVVFSDATLREMCLSRPSNLEQMADINGVGPKKLEEYGLMFLERLSAGADGP
ncbi:MAG: DNA helicase RecQ [Rhodospirillaceae bacterium]|nr:DNA helicase RecQ [Rhodospirillaceae bacterium]